MKKLANIIFSSTIASSLLGNGGNTKLESFYLANIALYLPQDDKANLRLVSSNGQEAIKMLKTNTEPIYTEKDALVSCEKLFDEKSMATQSFFNTKYTGTVRWTESGKPEITVNGLTGIVEGDITPLKRGNVNRKFIKKPTIKTQSGKTYECGDIELLGKDVFIMTEYKIPDTQIRYKNSICANKEDAKYIRDHGRIVFPYPFNEDLCQYILRTKISIPLTFSLADSFAESCNYILPHTGNTASILDLLIQGGLTPNTAREILQNNPITISFIDSFFIPDEVEIIDYNDVNILSQGRPFRCGSYPNITRINMNCVIKFHKDFWNEINFPNVESVDFSGLQEIPVSFFTHFSCIPSLPNLRKIDNSGAAYNKMKEITLQDYEIKLKKHCFLKSHQLQKINLGGVKIIPSRSFENCESLKQIIAHEAIEIKQHCFLGNSIEAVCFPKAKIMGAEAFLGTQQLEVAILPSFEKIISQDIEDTISRISKIKGTFCFFTGENCCFNNPKLRVFIPEGTRLDRCYFIQNNVEAFIDYPSISEENIIYLSREEIAGSHMLANVITILSLEQYQVLVDFLKQNSTEAILRILRALNQVAQHPTKERNMFLEQLKTCSPQQIQTWLQRLSR